MYPHPAWSSAVVPLSLSNEWSIKENTSGQGVFSMTSKKRSNYFTNIFTMKNILKPKEKFRLCLEHSCSYGKECSFPLLLWQHIFFLKDSTLKWCWSSFILVHRIIALLLRTNPFSEIRMPHSRCASSQAILKINVSINNTWHNFCML